MESVLRKLLFFYAAFVFVDGHNNKHLNDADLQSALMPQELNPVFVPDADQPWRTELPLPRIRRNSEVKITTDTTMNKLQTYSRIISCVVLSISALIELVVYVLESYYS